MNYLPSVRATGKTIFCYVELQIDGMELGSIVKDGAGALLGAFLGGASAGVCS